MERTLGRFVIAVDRLNDRVGRGAAWLTLGMVLIAFLVVVLRYVFSLGWVWMQESYVWLHGIVFMIGAGYTLLHGGHVRVDIFYRPKSARFKAWVDLGGVFALLIPVMILVMWMSWEYVLSSWSKFEESREAGGLPALFLLKTVIWAFCILVALQGLSLAGRSLLILLGHDEFLPSEKNNEGI